MSANTLGRYHIIRELARSNDIVYEAMDPTTGRKIALKELLIAPNLVGQQRTERIQRFTREARAAARLQHKNIVRVFDHGQAQGRYYIAMEFLEGQSLRDVLRQRSVMPLQEALRIAAAVADGLDYAHGQGVVHRDIKPDNVHLEPDGRAVITDFGIARLTFEASLTADGQIFGTPSYMSPEQITGKGVDKRCDLFSLGVMLYEMVSGRKPFTGDSVVTITYNIMNMEPPPIVGAPPAVDQIIRRAMAKDSGRRYQSAKDLAEDLRLAAQGQAPRNAMMPAASGPPRSNGASKPASMPPPAQLGPAAGPIGYQKPLPQPMLRGSGSGAPPMPPPLPGPVAMGGPLPGARPMARPMGPALPGPLTPGTPVSAPVGAMAPVPNGAPQPQWAPAPQPARGGFDFGWLFGWIAMVIVVGCIIIGLVWAVVMAKDKVTVESNSRQSTDLQTRAANEYNSKKYAEALADYQKAAEVGDTKQRTAARQNGAKAALALAYDEVEKKSYKDAETHAGLAAQLDQNWSDAEVVLGRALAGQGRVEDAVSAFEKAMAIAKDKDRQIALNWKLDTLYKSGVALAKTDTALARQRFQAILDAAPNSDFAASARMQMGGLPSSNTAVPSGTPTSGGGNGTTGTLPFSGITGMGSSPGSPSGTLSDQRASPGAGAPKPPPGWDPSYKAPADR